MSKFGFYIQSTLFIAASFFILACSQGVPPSPEIATKTSAPEMGGGVIAGGDTADILKDSAWFLGPDTIKYCIERDENFPVSLGDLKSLIEKAYKTWDKYLAQSGFNTFEPDLLDYLQNVDGRELSFLLLSRKRILVENCSNEVDLTFYFGGTSPAIESAKKRLNKPLSFALRTQYDERKGWGKGLIWFGSPKSLPYYADWSKQYLLLMMLVHEIGHTIGNNHISNTIMTARTDTMLSSINNEEHYLRVFADGEGLPKIDIENVLFSCLRVQLIDHSADGNDFEMKNARISCPTRYFEARHSGTLKLDPDVEKGPVIDRIAVDYQKRLKRINALFAEWMGRKIEGEVKFSLLFEKPYALLTVKDAIGSREFPIWLSRNNISFTKDISDGVETEKLSFYRAVRNEEDINGMGAAPLPLTLYAQITDPNGKKHELSIEMKSADIVLSFFVESQMERLYFSTAKEEVPSCDMRVLSWEAGRSAYRLYDGLGYYGLVGKFNAEQDKGRDSFQDLYRALDFVHEELIQKNYSRATIRSSESFEAVKARVATAEAAFAKMVPVLSQEHKTQWYKFLNEIQALEECIAK